MPSLPTTSIKYTTPSKSYATFWSLNSKARIMKRHVSLNAPLKPIGCDLLSKRHSPTSFDTVAREKIRSSILIITYLREEPVNDAEELHRSSRSHHRRRERYRVSHSTCLICAGSACRPCRY